MRSTMGVLFNSSNAPSARDAENQISDKRHEDIICRIANNASLSQVDGATDSQQHVLDTGKRTNNVQPTVTQTHLQHHDQGHYLHQAQYIASTQVPPRQQTRTSRNAVSDLLPYCTTEPPLSQEQVIALTDAVGSLKELVLLALGAASGDTGCVDRLEGAVGGHAAANIVEFFVDEWEIDG
ncbi:uncharacterized protein K460DRAFT_208642 [Cucurbitaria berberidis CBS 394.84]|uniref:Uncharacterized protein n=1 Tax=Cucurbitaria berberidis CBS 394.84 TaxID=1168544 RepID=A0A9P4G814_9PLEO|nr:uncharacterized protein K460DRAFT_208642 [Cucurbitaria berberidis CBS 394.84]KAF1840444.1 hypothetical protein K460DRAFT_208642 [Cucurbitaria berberidis CBS 394.84]